MYGGYEDDYDDMSSSPVDNSAVATVFNPSKSFAPLSAPSITSPSAAHLDATTMQSETIVEMNKQALQKTYCQRLDLYGFSCLDPSSRTQQVVEECSAPVESKFQFGSDSVSAFHPMVTAAVEQGYDCIADAIEDFSYLESLRFFHLYLYFAAPLVFIAIVFNAIALVSVVNLKVKLSRHFILFVMSISDSVVSLSALLRRIDENLHHVSELSYTRQLLVGMWQFTWLMSGLCLLALAADMFVCLTKPHHYTRPAVKLAAVIGLAVMTCVAALTVVLLGVLGLQENDVSQYVACALILVIILLMCASHIYACISAEMLQLKIQRSKADKTLRTNKSFLRKSVVTTSLLIMSSLFAWIPLLIYWLIPENIINSNLPTFFKILTICLVCFHLNAVVNPLIYAYRFRDVRNSMKQLSLKCLIFLPIEFRNRHFRDHSKSSSESPVKKTSQSRATMTNLNKNSSRTIVGGEELNSQISSHRQHSGEEISQVQDGQPSMNGDHVTGKDDTAEHLLPDLTSE